MKGVFPDSMDKHVYGIAFHVHPRGECLTDWFTMVVHRYHANFNLFCKISA